MFLCRRAGPLAGSANDGRGVDKRLVCHDMEADFAPVARALSARGLNLSMRAGSGLAPRVRTGDATILWHRVDDPAARARALEGGAQDVVGPWMHEAETVARIVRLAREEEPRLVLGDLSIGLVERSVERAGRPIALLAREYALLLYLARRCGECVTREELLRAVWRLHFDPGTNSVEVHMSRLRAKIDRGFDRPLLHTEKGRGYRLGGAGA